MEKNDFIKNDPPLYFFEKTANILKKIFAKNNQNDINNTYFTFIIFIFYLAIPVILTAIQGTLLPDNNPEFKSLLEDTFMFAMLILMIPISYVIHSFYKKIPEVTVRLKKVLIKSQKTDDLNFNILNKRWIKIVSTIGLIITFYLFYVGGYLSSNIYPEWLGNPIRNSAYIFSPVLQWFIYVYFKFLTCLVWFEMFSLAIKGILIFSQLNNIFKNHELKLRRFSPDGCGGLRSIGELSLHFFTIVSIIGIYIFWFSILTFKDAPDSMLIFMIATILLYIILGPVIFFGPLYLAHFEIKKLKHLELIKIENNLEKHQKIIDKLIDPDLQMNFLPKDMERHSQAIKHLKREKQEWEEVNNWPIDKKIFNGFIGRYISPLLLFPINFLFKEVLSNLIFH